MSVLWLRTAAALYSCGLLYALIYLFSKSTRLFKPTLTAVAAGLVFHLVSLVELWHATGHVPLSNFFESSSVCGFLIALLFLIAYAIYRVAIFGVCLFPIVFFMTLIGLTEFPINRWSSPEIRSVWLAVHVGSVLIGCAALIISAAASIYYLLQERQLKSKQVSPAANRLPPLGILDRIITESMNAGFVFMTVGTATGLIFAFIETGTRWVSDPRIAFFLFTWVFYLAMIFLRVSAGWRGRRMAWLAVSVLVCFLLSWATHYGLRSVWAG